MDILYPAILEIPVNCTNFGNQISSSCLPSFLKPSSIEGFRNVSGKYKIVRPRTYVYHFDNMKSASKATMRHLEGLTIRTAKVFDKEVPKTFPEFDPPMEFIPESVLDEYIQRKICSIVNAESINVQEATKGVLKACNEEIHPATILKGNEEIRNEFLMNWLNIHYSYFVIEGNEYLDETSVTFHQSSKPDFCLFIPKCDNNVISAAAIDMNDDAAIDLNDDAAIDLNDDAAIDLNDDLFGLATGRPQTIANMVAVAGSLANDALRRGRKFHSLWA